MESAMVTLSDSEKLIVLACGFGAVALTVILVVCVVTPVCPLHRLLPARARIHFTPLVKRKLKRKCKLENGSDVNGNANEEKIQLKQTSTTYVSYSNDLGHHIHQNGSGPTDKSSEERRPSSPQPPDTLGYKPAHQQRRPTILSTQGSTVDSTYSSMTPTGSRPSTPVSSKSDHQDMMSTSADSSSVRSTDCSPLYGSVTVSLQLSTTEDPTTVRLLIGVQEAQDLPPRDSVSCGDPFFRVSVMKETRAFRRSKSRPNLLAEFETNIQKKTRHPIYNQKFAKEMAKTDIKDSVVRFAAFDKDKYANPTEFGETAVALKNLNLTVQGQPVLFSLELSEPKQNNGELQMSVMYLPTAERLAFSLFKVVNLRPDALKGDPERCKIFVRVILLHNGKMVSKKKTSFAEVTTALCFNESIAFDVPTEQIQNLSFVVVVIAVHKEPTSLDTGNSISPPDSTHSTTGVTTGQERCVGKVVLGPKTKSTGLQHWELAMQRPREQVALWHVLR